MYLEITVLWARIIEIKSLSLELTFLHFPPIEINFKNWAWISSNSRQLCLSMGRNYRCWIVWGLRARAPVKCLCFPPCLPSKDLHILTHYGVLWSWSAWLPQPAIMLIASEKLKSFKASWPHSWWGGMYVCFSPSPSFSLFFLLFLFFNLQLRLCEGLDLAALEFLQGMFAGTLKQSVECWRKACIQGLGFSLALCVCLFSPFAVHAVISSESLPFC